MQPFSLVFGIFVMVVFICEAPYKVDDSIFSNNSKTTGYWNCQQEEVNEESGRKVEKHVEEEPVACAEKELELAFEPKLTSFPCVGAPGDIWIAGKRH